MRFHDILVSTLLGATIPVQAASLMRNERAAGLDKKSQIVCSSEPPIKAAPHKNFWSSLTREETTNVLAFLHANATGLNLTLADEAGEYAYPCWSWV
jgi:primary-amine oxidase